MATNWSEPMIQREIVEINSFVLIEQAEKYAETGLICIYKAIKLLALIKTCDTEEDVVSFWQNTR